MRWNVEKAWNEFGKKKKKKTNTGPRDLRSSIKCSSKFGNQELDLSASISDHFEQKGEDVKKQVIFNQIETRKVLNLKLEIPLNYHHRVWYTHDEIDECRNSFENDTLYHEASPAEKLALDCLDVDKIKINTVKNEGKLGDACPLTVNQKIKVIITKPESDRDTSERTLLSQFESERTTRQELCRAINSQHSIDMKPLDFTVHVDSVREKTSSTSDTASSSSCGRSPTNKGYSSLNRKANSSGRSGGYSSLERRARSSSNSSRRDSGRSPTRNGVGYAALKVKDGNTPSSDATSASPGNCSKKGSIETDIFEYKNIDKGEPFKLPEESMFKKYSKCTISEQFTGSVNTHSSTDSSGSIIRPILKEKPAHASPRLSEYDKKRLISFYRKHNPNKISQVDDTLIEYFGREEKMFSKLEEKYGENPTKPWLTEFYEQHNPSKLDQVDSTLKEYRGREEQLYTKLTEKYGIEEDDEVSL